MNITTNVASSSSVTASGGVAMEDSTHVDFESIFETMHATDGDAESAQCGSYAGCRRTSCGTSSFINW